MTKNYRIFVLLYVVQVLSCKPYDPFVQVNTKLQHAGNTNSIGFISSLKKTKQKEEVRPFFGEVAQDDFVFVEPVSQEKSHQEPQETFLLAEKKDEPGPVEEKEPVVFPYQRLSYENKGMTEKKEEVELFVERACTHLQEKSFLDACFDFANHKEWKENNHYLFVMENAGICCLDNENHDATWWTMQPDEFEPFLEVNQQGKWIFHSWKSDGRFSYVQKIEHQGKEYYIGSSLHLEEREARLQELMPYMTHFIHEKGIESFINILSSRSGFFLRGQGRPVVTLLNEDAVICADTRSSALEGTSVKDIVDDTGFPFYPSLMKEANEHKPLFFKVSIQDYENIIGAQTVYVPSKTGDKASRYTLVVHFLEEVDLEDVKGLVVNASFHIQQHQWERVQKDLNSLQSKFCINSLRIMVFKEDGEILVDPFYIHNQQKKPEYVAPVLRALKHDQEEGISYVGENGYTQIFYRLIKTLHGNYIVCSEFYPLKRASIAKALLNTLSFFARHEGIESLASSLTFIPEQIMPGGFFGDIYGAEGIALARSYIQKPWQTFPHAKNWKEIIDLAQAGGGQYGYKNQILHVRKVEKKNRHIQEDASVLQKKFSSQKGRDMSVLSSGAPVIGRHEKVTPEDGYIIAVWYFV